MPLGYGRNGSPAIGSPVASGAAPRHNWSCLRHRWPSGRPSPSLGSRVGRSAPSSTIVSAQSMSPRRGFAAGHSLSIGTPSYIVATERVGPIAVLFARTRCRRGGIRLLSACNPPCALARSRRPASVEAYPAEYPRRGFVSPLVYLLPSAERAALGSGSLDQRPVAVLELLARAAGAGGVAAGALPAGGQGRRAAGRRAARRRRGRRSRRRSARAALVLAGQRVDVDLEQRRLGRRLGRRLELELHRHQPAGDVLAQVGRSASRTARRPRSCTRSADRAGHSRAGR